MECYLQRLNVFKVVTGELTAENNPDRFERDNAEALYQISLTLDTNVLELVYGERSANNVWTKLCKYYERQGADRIVFLNRRLTNDRMKVNDSVEQYCYRIKSTVDELKVAGMNVEQITMVATILGGLREEFRTIKNALQVLPPHDLTFEKVISQLRTAELDLEYNGSKSSTNQTKSEQLFAVNANIQCWQCGQQGHFKNQCPYRKNNKNYNQNQHKQSRAQQVQRQNREARQPREAVHSLTYTPQETNNNNDHDITDAGNEQQADNSLYLLTVSENCESTNAQPKDYWVIDSGATSHMSWNKEILADYVAYPKPVKVQLGKRGNYVDAFGEGKLTVFTNINSETQPVTLDRVLYGPSLASNFFSVPTVEQKGFKVLFGDSQVFVINSKFENILQGRFYNGLYIFDFNLSLQEAVNAAFINNSEATLWHRRLGHPCPKVLQKLQKLENSKILQNQPIFDNMFNECAVCIKGKLPTKAHQAEISGKSTKKGETTHFDVVRPMNPVTFSQFKFALTIVDDHTSFTTAYLLKNKNEVLQKIQSYSNFLNNNLQSRMLYLHSDRGTEFNNSEVKDFCENNGIQLQFTARYSPQSNGVAERCNRTLFDKVRCLLIEASLPKSFWGEALMYACLLKNLTTIVNNKTAYELFLNKKPCFNKIKVFGCSALCKIPDNLRTKLEPKAQDCIFLGLPSDGDGYKLLLKQNNSVVIERTVKFFEQSCDENNNDYTNFEFDFSQLENNNNTVENNDGNYSNDPRRSNRVRAAPNRFDDEFAFQMVHSPPFSKPCKVEQLLSLAESESWSAYPTEMIHESEIVEPRNLNEILTNKHKNYWAAAVKDEFTSLTENKTWEQINSDCEPSNVIGSKYVFKAKSDSQGFIFRFKARIVAQGYTQRENIDYHETFAPVPHLETVRTAVAFCASKKWYLHHCDVDTAFLYADLKETLYLCTPAGYQTRLGRVVLLKKTIYGLKQSPQEWNSHIKATMNSLGFIQSKVDQCLYFKVENTVICNLVVIWVDDILNGGEQLCTVEKVVNQLRNFYKIKDLKTVEYFLSMKFYNNSQGQLCISQENYVQRLLNKFQMENCNPTHLPAGVGESVGNGQPNDENFDKTLYRQLIGGLLFLARSTRMDISWIVNQLARFQENPTVHHWNLGKRVLRYLKGTPNFGLKYTSGDVTQIKIFCDASYSNPNDGKSTSGYIICVGNCVVAWATKKQSVVALSTTEAELISMCRAVQEGQFILHLLTELLVSPNCTVFNDNKGSISIALKNQTNRNTKHIATRNYFLKDLIQQKIISIEYVQSTEMLADFMTKQLPKEKLTYQLSQLNFGQC